MRLCGNRISVFFSCLRHTKESFLLCRRRSLFSRHGNFSFFYTFISKNFIFLCIIWKDNFLHLLYVNNFVNLWAFYNYFHKNTVLSLVCNDLLNKLRLQKFFCIDLWASLFLCFFSLSLYRKSILRQGCLHTKTSGTQVLPLF